MITSINGNSVLEKVLNSNAKFDPEQFLTTKDLVFCLKQQDVYNELLENYDYNLKMIEQMEDISSVSIVESASGKGYLSHGTKNTTWATYLYFSPNYPKLFILKAAKKARHGFIDVIKNYLQETYNVSFPEEFKNSIPKDQPINYIHVVKALLKSVNFQNLSSEGENNLKEEVRRVLIGMRCGVEDEKWYTVRGRRLSIDSGVYYQSYSGYSFWRIEKRFASILKGLSFFENESLDILPIFSNPMPVNKDVDFSKIYNCPGSEKVEGIKFYKNSKIDVVFESLDDLQDFKALFMID